ncbi:uncharacterized protein EI90DRAFT_3154245 [Cantharellus anzutake]|uniref:uncharacterized protein n=1 Tax=Cantharellus anzutake TaxID=1750568 RepID=UPI001903BA4C|nr:uncharacterized protein EI90DRAFT_3154245 [Cantharellus anzutake]KAF8332391.1 hypothetical protein EI90DRAFT_3154245 [Cantharellus anzutake]
MSRIDQSTLTLVGTEDPKYYAELACRIPNRRPLSDEKLCSDIQGVDEQLSQRLRALLDAVADISLRKRGNVSATMASVMDNKGTLETQVYIAFNHEDDDAASSCSDHLRSVFDMLSQVPYKPHGVDSSPKDISKEPEGSLTEVCRAIHNYSFDIFAYRVNKREHKLSTIRRYIEQDVDGFTPNQRSTLLLFLQHVGMIIEVVANAQATKQLSAADMRMLLAIYLFWTHNGLLPKDGLADNVAPLLDYADTWLAENYNIGFQLRRWAVKIMSLVISADRLLTLTQSRRLHKIIKGKFAIQPLPRLTTTPYRCNLSSENIRVALDAALAGTTYCTAEWDERRESFIARLRNGLEGSEVARWEPTVHAELAMITAMFKGELQRVLPYIGVSKLSCIMCTHYIQAFNDVTGVRIAVKGSHGKAYPGWFWPNLPSCDGEVREAFLGLIRQQLQSDFKLHYRGRVSVGYDLPGLELVVTAEDIKKLFALRNVILDD